MFRRSTNIHTGGELRQRVHPAATSFREVSHDNKRLFFAAMQAVRSLGYSGKCYAFGSRTHGTFSEHSDIDIMVDLPLIDYLKLVHAAKDIRIEGRRIDLQRGRLKRIAELWEINDKLSK